jgi:CheY-like chemotaxis protein
MREGSLKGEPIRISADRLDPKELINLECYEIEVVYAENGVDGVETLKNTSDISAVIIDIMMPETDGCENHGAYP